MTEASHQHHSGSEQAISWKPYTSYMESGVEWVDAVPSHWKLRPLFTVAKERNETNTSNRVQSVLSLSYGRIVERDVSDNFGLLPESFDAYQILHPGNIVLRLTDLQNDKRSLRVGLVKQHGIITSAYVGLELQAGLDPSYGYYLLHSFDVTKVFYSFGGGVRQTMKFEDLKRLPVFTPPPKEQEFIATFLDRETSKIDALVAKKERLIEFLQEKRAALITHVVTKGLDPNVPMKDSGVEWLGQIPAHWTVRRLKFLAPYVTSGSRGWAEYYTDEGPIFLRIGNLSRNGIDLDLRDIERVTPPAGSEGERTRVKPEDLLISITAYIGSVGVVPPDFGEGYVSQHIALARLASTGVLPRWLAYCLLSSVGQKQFQSLLYGGTKEGLGLDDVRNLIVLLPVRREQESIINYMDHETAKLDALIAKGHEGIEVLKEYRTALIYAAVTGKIDVRAEVTPAPVVG